MELGEFSIIKQFFSSCGAKKSDCLLAVGDDAALLQTSSSQILVATQDTLVATVHFFPDTDPEALGHKALAVNLSDLAAMGAKPAWFTLGLTIPQIDTKWLQAFAYGLCSLATSTNTQLIGGDTTSGPLAISITALGWLPAFNNALLRSGAKPGDHIYVSGTLGDAGLALYQLTQGSAVSTIARKRLERPTPRLKLGQALLGLANAAIDISDGLLADLGHILTNSNVGAVVYLAAIPHSSVFKNYLEQGGDPMLAVTAGDDYELCFTVPSQNIGDLMDIATSLSCPIAYIGEISSEPGLRLYDSNKNIVTPQRHGYAHF
ncbi:hypothetical protein TI05_11725 [Achromatium sp. WMS3]|nr:hypothetical protein TI05_11725 [Achromatium sp. WMS3]